MEKRWAWDDPLLGTCEHDTSTRIVHLLDFLGLIAWLSTMPMCKTYNSLSRTWQGFCTKISWIFCHNLIKYLFPWREQMMIKLTDSIRLLSLNGITTPFLECSLSKKLSHTVCNWCAAIGLELWIPLLQDSYLSVNVKICDPRQTCPFEEFCVADRQWLLLSLWTMKRSCIIKSTSYVANQNKNQLNVHPRTFSSWWSR